MAKKPVISAKITKIFQFQLDQEEMDTDTLAEVIDQAAGFELALAKANKDGVAIMAAVVEFVEYLNTIEYLIETDEREALWEYIQPAAIAAGLITAEADITEPYRDW